MPRSMIQEKLLALPVVAPRQWEAGQEDPRTDDCIQRGACKLARVVERLHRSDRPLFVSVALGPASVAGGVSHSSAYSL